MGIGGALDSSRSSNQRQHFCVAELVRSGLMAAALTRCPCSLTAFTCQGQPEVRYFKDLSFHEILGIAHVQA